jgi:hypothetical protein
MKKLKERGDVVEEHLKGQQMKQLHEDIQRYINA